MTPTDSQTRHLKYGRFGRNSSVGRSASPESGHGRRLGRWTGYRPLEDAVTQARLAALVETVEKQMEERA
ncbi:MAG: hypothetical protein AAB092_01955 [Chloroflexota bacterium]